MSNYGKKIRENLPASLMDLLDTAAQQADENRQGIVIVGGAVRDLLMGKQVGEVDLMLDPPVRPVVEEVAKISHGRLVVHDTFQTYTIHFPDGTKLDVVTAREESYKSSGALPEVVPSSIPQDLKRRDFSINAMALWLNKRRFGDLADPFDGVSDLHKRLIRVLHPMSFVDDPTRIFRAARFAGRFGFHLEADTEKLLLKTVSAGVPNVLSPVRRRHEFELILKEGNPLPALKFLKKWDALSFLHPQWELKPEHEAVLGGPLPTTMLDVLTLRLVEWLKPWGHETAKIMMTDLSFEKAVKKRVLLELDAEN